MITITDEQVTISKDAWDRLNKNFYYRELIENFLDTEELIEAINTSTELIDIREYAKQRRNRKIPS